MKTKIFIIGAFLILLITVAAFIPSFLSEEPLLLEAADEESTMALAENDTLTEKINAVLEKEELDGAVAGVTVKHAANSKILYSYNGETRLHPASNMKLLTAAAALETLGADYQFHTEVLTDGKQVDTVLQGNLYLKGKGDPTLLKSDLDQFAKELKAQGIRLIKGNIIGDDTWYDNVRLSQDLNWSDESFYTGAQVSALTLSPDQDYDAGTLIVEVIPDKKAEGKAQVRINPETDYVTISNQTKMVPAGEAKQITIEREHGSNRVILTGTMPADGTISRSYVSVWEPAGYALSLFHTALKEHGIKFTGDMEKEFKATPQDAHVLATKESIPLSELLFPFMKLSNNGHGEMLTKEMGKVVHGEGSWDKGLEVIPDVMETFDMNPDTILLRDGSGMSHKTLISTNNLTQLLFAAQDKSWFNLFKQSLPVAGEADRYLGGTLRNRMTEAPVKGNVKAKTGLITGVSALSGYVTAANGEELIFSILINNYLGSTEEMHAIENEIATILAEHEF